MSRFFRLIAGALIAVSWLQPAPVRAHFLAPGVVNQVIEIYYGMEYLNFQGLIDYGELQAPAIEKRADEAGDGDGSVTSEELQAGAALICADWLDALMVDVDGWRAVWKFTGAEAHPYREDGSGQLYELHCRADAEMSGRIDVGSTVSVSSEYLNTVPGSREYYARPDFGEVTRSSMVTRDPTENTYTFSVIPNPTEATPPATEPTPSPSPTPDPLGEWEGQLPGLPRDLPSDLPSGLAALLFAALIGAGHALTPGHGKTLISAALLGRRASTGRAIAIGLSVSVAHTLGVLLMAIVVSTIADPSLTGGAARYAPAVAAGVMVLIGLWMLRDARHGGDHHHHHNARRDHVHGGAPTPGSMRALLLLGVSGGIVPSASALVVLVGAIAAGAAAWGVAIVLAFGLGMAFVMSVVAIAATRLGRLLDRPRGWLHVLAHRLPLLSAIAVLLIASGLLVSALTAV